MHNWSTTCNITIHVVLARGIDVKQTQTQVRISEWTVRSIAYANLDLDIWHQGANFRHLVQEMTNSQLSQFTTPSNCSRAFGELGKSTARHLPVQTTKICTPNGDNTWIIINMQTMNKTTFKLIYNLIFIFVSSQIVKIEMANFLQHQITVCRRITS